MLVTTERTQLVLMSIEVGSEIGEERHAADQILFFVEGEGTAFINGEESPVFAGHCVVVPAGSLHNFTNKGKDPLKLFTLYAPPQHEQGEMDPTKYDAEKKEK